MGKARDIEHASARDRIISAATEIEAAAVAFQRACKMLRENVSASSAREFAETVGELHDLIVEASEVLDGGREAECALAELRARPTLVPPAVEEAAQ